MLDRRRFISASASATGLMLSPWLQNLMGAPAPGKPPMRFIFMHKGNGLLPHTLVPPTLS